MKLNSVERIEQALINGLFYGVAKAELDEKDVRRINGFVAAYSPETMASLSIGQLLLLYMIVLKDSENTDHLSFSMGWSRRTTINAANGLVRRGLCYWDLPTSSNMDAGNDLTLDRDKLIDREILRIR